MIDHTHNPELRSWVTSANLPNCEFPIQNLPFAVLRERNSRSFHPAVAIGDYALNLAALVDAGLIEESILKESRLNAFMARGRGAHRAVRTRLVELLSNDVHRSSVEPHLIPVTQVEFDLPCHIGDFTDFYTSIHHATNVGKLFRPDNPLLPNYEWVPIAYHSRSSSVVGSDTPIQRPVGQLKSPDQDVPKLAPCERLDFELEVGIFVGAGNELGQSISIEDAENHIFGLCLLNDWSARDIQAWEYQPLGPFLAKSFATTISPWVVTMDALAPFRAPWKREDSRPQPLPYLSSAINSEVGAIDMQIEVALATKSMLDNGATPEVISNSNFTHSYWSVAQLTCHHSVNGCNLQPGDLFGSGTMSGFEAGSKGALIEITNGGQNPLTLESGETRSFLQDGDQVILRGRCQRDGFQSIGFGEARGQILPAIYSVPG